MTDTNSKPIPDCMRRIYGAEIEQVVVDEPGEQVPDDPNAVAIREAFARGGWPAAIRVATDLALADLQHDHEHAKAVSAMVASMVEQENPDVRRERVGTELASLGLGKRRRRK